MQNLKAASAQAVADFKLDCGRSWPKASRARLLWALVVDSGLRAVLYFRAQQVAYESGCMPLARLVSRKNLRSHGIDIVPGARIGPGFVVRHPVGIVVGSNVVAGSNLTLLHGTTLGQLKVDSSSCSASNPQIGDEVVIGAGATVLGSVVIGDRAVIGASAVVLHDVPAVATVVGNPARILFQTEPDRSTS